MSRKNDIKEIIAFADALIEHQDAVAVEIGHVVIEWNSLHQGLAKVFAQIISPHNNKLGLSAWNALQHDRAQRDMLEAVAIAKFGTKSKFVKELCWALGQLKPLEDERNTALHAPYGLIVEEGAIKFIPIHFFGHRRAQKLKDKDLRLEFQSAVKRFRLLKTFINHLAAHIDDKGTPKTWPERPRLPRPAHQMSRKARPLQNTDK